MNILPSGSSYTFTLLAGDVLTVTSRGGTTVTGPSGLLGTVDGTSRFGSYSSNTSITITAVGNDCEYGIIEPSVAEFAIDASGNVTGLVGPNGEKNLITGGQYPSGRIRVGTFGDSIADIATAANATAQSVDNATAATTPIIRNTSKMGAWFGFFSGGQLHPVFNGGVSGETTAQIATRAAAAESTASTSKSMLNAQLYGCDFIVFSMGINDFAGYTTATSQATIDAGIASAVDNVKKCIKKARSLGIYSVFQSALPFGTEGSVTANQSVVNTTAKEYNKQIAAYISTCPEVATYYDARSLVEGSDGGWTAAMTADGTHPNQAGAVRMYANMVRSIKRLSGVGEWRNALPKSKNIFSNADLSASASGLATGITIAGVDGTTTNTIEVIDGVNVQQVVWAPSNASGTNSSLSIDIDLNAAGAAPNVSLAIGDILAVEYDLTVDNGLGGPPNVWALTCYLRKNVGAAPTIFNSLIAPYGGASELYYQDALIGKVSGGLITIDEATSASSGKIFARVALTGKTQTSPVRVRISNIRCVKVATTY